ncbi:TspO/MBR family protein [Cellulomonas sp. C5510]|uniref:TspO/MBR family protein n=1 Tax=Cellulomonas sp. C5510 TaxID=2871170 RepID=UPI001C94F59A|nr:TspO/MBR family protein [Cellulomonas sp. C5510]QZN84274.1 tryptophan-rich sensory protein [Cellulomonas sp. C5510]
MTSTHPDVPATTSRDAAPASRGWPVLVALLAVNAAVAWGGGLASTSAVDGWYAAADKPAWTPPDWVFGPVWTVLYVLMAVAAWLLWRRHGARAGRTALVLYGVQLALNAAWTPVFFGAQQLGAGLVIILALEVALVATVVAFHRLSPAVAWLLGPYLAWVLYATTLNAGVLALS